MIAVYDYLNYRLYLKDAFREHKALNKGFTYRYIAQKLNLKSAGHVTQILQGKARITSKVLLKLIPLLTLTEQEAHYFTLLVTYGQSHSLHEKQETFKSLTSLRKTSTYTLNDEQLIFYQKWYYSAVRDYLELHPFSGSDQSLAKEFYPPISVEQVQEALQILRQLGLIILGKEGRYEVTTKLIEIDNSEEIKTVLASYAETMIEKSKYALYHIPKEQRNISWVGFSVSSNTYDLIQDEIRAFRTRILRLVEEDTSPTRVYQMNIQCFPLTKKGKNSHDQ